MTDDITSRFLEWYSGDIADCLDALGRPGVLRGIDCQTALPPSGKICGRARTVSFRPSTAKVVTRNYHRAIDAVTPGDILVVATAGGVGSCTGELMCSGAKAHGALATIVDGSVRDIAQVRGMNYPLFANRIEPLGAYGRLEDHAFGEPVILAGVTVTQGDLIFCDADGTVVVPQELAERVANMAEELGRAEGGYRRRIEAGESVLDVFSHLQAGG